MTDTIANARAVDAAQVRAMIMDGNELALIDVREELTFSERHMLHARSVPLSRLELRIAQLVPRRDTRMVLVDDDDGFSERAAAVLSRFGYSDLHILNGGNAAWERAGFELFSGVNVPSKAFGELVEHESGTPSIDANELERMMRAKADIVVLDSRPLDEFRRMSIPTARNVPGAELVLRVGAIAPKAETTVVVNCAGRTRSIIGAQSLINAGIANKVVALRNGTMGWHLAGYQCDSGREQGAPMPSGEALARAKQAAEDVARRTGVQRIDQAALAQWRNDKTRTLYVFDVRDPPEYAAGHVAGARSAPGGQLVQATDEYVGVLGARIVLIDDKDVRALMTASWLRQMGWKDVAVLNAVGTEKGFPPPTVLGADPRPDLQIVAADLAARLKSHDATVIDLSLSRNYRKGHIAGAWFAIRARLDQALRKIPHSGALVLTSEDGVLAGLAALEAAALTRAPVHYLKGGNSAWQAAGLPFGAGDEKWADEPVDAWLKPYERLGGAPEKAMQAYLDWETDLLPRIARDGTTAFRPLR